MPSGSGIEDTAADAPTAIALLDWDVVTES